jgi:hypothetical protein
MTEIIKNHYKKPWVLFLCLFMLIGSLMVSCMETNLDELKDIPKIENKNGNKIFKRDFAYHFQQQRSFNSVPMKVPTDIKFLLWDNRYDQVDYYFFRKFNNWFNKLLFENGLLSLGENGEALDCENYAMLYKSTMSLANLKSGNKNELAVGIVVVRQMNEFARIPATGGLHAVNLVMTNKGWYIVEPQTNQFILLEDYPNQEYVQYIIF